ncbi:polyphosphate glucokinase [Acrocarpospora phusangensis]|uniref:Polyphosphate glucokinase n=1 Tax=Acrocarpospora phusangensis TaxID=1070424 RepID=A0A919UNF8_9ACTN|nr:ROK family protein [Acrocarpospora phusangensis]GIH28456.1 polyphosphate glucokinase [Acrocarpospora phusangensis]
MNVLGIDIGGSGIKGAPVDTKTGELVEERHRIPTPQPSTPDAVADVVQKIVKHFSWTGPIGLTFPGVVVNGEIRTAANVDSSWIGVEGRALFGKNTHLLNDADAAGIAEMTFGAGQGHQGVVLMLTFGTGIGSALFTGGKLVPNTEFGHIEIRGKEAERRASAQVREDKNLGWGDWADRVEEYLVEMERLLSPNLIILGGGVSKKAEKFLPDLKIKTPIIPAMLLNEAGIVGAALATTER